MASSDRNKLSKHELRDLAIEIDFLEGIARRDPAYVDALQVLGDDYTRTGRFQEGLRIDLQLVQLRPGDPLSHYNLGCSYSLTNQLDAAYEALNRAIDCGFDDFRWLSRDPDLAAFRKHRLYRKLRARVRSMKPG